MAEDRPLIVDLLPLEAGLLLAECVEPDGTRSFWVIGTGDPVTNAERTNR